MTKEIRNPNSERRNKSDHLSPNTDLGFRIWDFLRHSSFVIGISLSLLPAAALDIQLPPETGAFKQDTGAEIANGQCLTCHSVEYVVMQPPMPRAFWKSSIQKMQQKCGSPLPDDQVEALADYLTRNYGVNTNGASAHAPTQGSPQTTPAPVTGPGSPD